MASKFVHVCPECRCVVKAKILLVEEDYNSFLFEDNPLDDYLRIEYHTSRSETKIEACPGVGQNPLLIEIY